MLKLLKVIDMNHVLTYSLTINRKKIKMATKSNSRFLFKIGSSGKTRLILFALVFAIIGGVYLYKSSAETTKTEYVRFLSQKDVDGSSHGVEGYVQNIPDFGNVKVNRVFPGGTLNYVATDWNPSVSNRVRDCYFLHVAVNGIGPNYPTPIAIASGKNVRNITLELSPTYSHRPYWVQECVGYAAPDPSAKPGSYFNVKNLCDERRLSCNSLEVYTDEQTFTFAPP